MVSFTINVTEFTSVQVHADHLCSWEAHLGNWPVPPPNAILAPPFFSTFQLAKLGSRRRSSIGETDDDKQSSSGPVVSSGEPLKAKKYVKRRAKVTRKLAESSDEEEEEGQKQRTRQRRRKVLLGRADYVPAGALTTSDSEDKVAISGEIVISSEWKTNKSFAEEKTKSAATPCGVEAAVPPVPALTSSDSEDKVAISGEIDISSEWKTNKSFAEEKKTKSAATSCGSEAAVPPAPTLTSSSDSEDKDAISGEIDISSEWKTNKSFAEERKTKSAATSCGSEAAVPPSPTLTSSDSEDEDAISGEIDISSEWKTNKSFAEEKTKSASTPCGEEAAVPPVPTLTSFDSEDKVAISGEIDISSEWKTNKSFAEEKIKSASTPCEVPSLTESSADEEEAEVNTAEFRGGAGGSSNPVWRQLAERIMVGVRRARLPLRLPLDDITEGDGNCYFRALCSQLQRPEVAAPDHIRQLDHRSLRNKICNFMLKSKLPVVKTTKQNWLDFQDSELGEYNRYWADMRDSKGDIWAEGPVIHATTWFLERDIYLVSEKASEAEPFIAFSGNQDGTNASCAGAALWLGHLTGLHYQTLMPVPTEREMMPPRPELRKVEDTLKARAKAGEGTRMKQGTQVNFFKIRVHI